MKLRFSILQLLMQMHGRSWQALPKSLLHCFLFSFLSSVLFIYLKPLSFQCKVMLPQGCGDGGVGRGGRGWRGGGGGQNAFSALLTLWSIQNALVKIQPGLDAHKRG